MMMFTARALVSIVLWATARASDVDPHAMLRTASAEGNVDNVQHWLQQGGDVNGMSPSGWTPLIYAADRSQVNIIDILLQANANPNIPERDGWTPLMFSAVKGDLESCSLLIRGGADLEHVSKNDWTPLKAAQRSKNPEAASFMENEIAKSKEIKVDNVGLGRDFLQAVKDSDLGTARGMLDRGIDPNTLSPNGWTAVTYAAANGNVEMMKLLISHGTDINKADKDGWTPIMFAAFQGNLDAVELLISHGADVLAKNVAHTGALNMATNYANHKNDDRVKKVIATAGLSQSLRREDLDAVSDMIEVGGADVNYQDTHANSGRWTALILATAKRNLEAVAWLIGIGADPNIPEKDGWTPLFFAVFSNDAELCRLILEAGSDYHYRLSNGKSALDLARSRNAPDVIQVLEEHEERERLALEQGNNEDPARETLPNVVETGPSEEETTRERARLEQHQREQHQRDELRRRRQAELQRKEDYAEEDVRYEDVEAAEPESLVDKLMSFLGL